MTQLSRAIHVLVLSLSAIGCQSPGGPAATSAAKPAIPPAELATLSGVQLEDREDRLRDTVRRQPADGSAWLDLGLVQLERNAYDDAEVSLRKAVSLDRRSPLAHHALGRSLGERERYASAIVEGKKALKLDPGNDDLRAELGRWLREDGRVEEAIALWREGWRAVPANVACGMELAHLYVDRGDVAGAESILAVCAVHAPANVRLRQRHALLLDRMGRPVEAARVWEEVVAMGEGGGRAHYELARLHAETGRYEQAQESLQWAIAIDPEAPARSAAEIALRQSPGQFRQAVGYRPIAGDSTK